MKRTIRKIVYPLGTINKINHGFIHLQEMSDFASDSIGFP